MAEAVIGGIVEQGAVEPQNVFVMNKSDDDRLISLQNKYGVSIVCKEKKALEECGSCRSCDETKRYSPSMTDICPYLNKNTAVLSVIAGVSIQHN